MTRRLALLLLVILAGVSIGCERAKDRLAEEAIEGAIESQGREAEVDIDRERRRIAIQLGGDDRPEGWPQDLPIHPGGRKAKVEAGGASFGLEFRIPAEELDAYYREELASQGWAVSAGGDAIVARKGERRLRIDVRTVPGSRRVTWKAEIAPAPAADG